jgi:hypothetical protein
MSRTRQEIREERRRLRAEYGELFDSVAALLFRRDPISIGADAPTDEYEPETGTILPRLRNCHSEEDARQVVYEEFVRWFGSDTAGPEESYREISSEIWRLWCQYRQLSNRRAES